MEEKLLFISYDSGTCNFVSHVYDYRARLGEALGGYSVFFPRHRVVAAVYFEDRALPCVEWRCRLLLSDPAFVQRFRSLLNGGAAQAVIPRVVRIESYAGQWCDYPLVEYSAAGGGGFYIVPSHRNIREDDVRVAGCLGSAAYLAGVNGLFYGAAGQTAVAGVMSGGYVPALPSAGFGFPPPSAGLSGGYGMQF